jgi:hypothetical protein
MLTCLQAEAALNHVASTLLEATTEDHPIRHAFRHEGIQSIADLISTPRDHINTMTYMDADTRMEVELSQGHKKRICLLRCYVQWRINERRPIQPHEWLNIPGDEFLMYLATPCLQGAASDPPAVPHVQAKSSHKAAMHWLPPAGAEDFQKGLKQDATLHYIPKFVEDEPNMQETKNVGAQMGCGKLKKHHTDLDAGDIASKQVQASCTTFTAGSNKHQGTVAKHTKHQINQSVVHEHPAKPGQEVGCFLQTKSSTAPLGQMKKTSRTLSTAENKTTVSHKECLSLLLEETINYNNGLETKEALCDQHSVFEDAWDPIHILSVKLCSV